MTGVLLVVGALALVACAWMYMNHWYRLIHGRRLRWPYFWAAHGAVMFRKRFPEWEQQGPGRKSGDGPVA